MLLEFKLEGFTHDLRPHFKCPSCETWELYRLEFSKGKPEVVEIECCLCGKRYETDVEICAAVVECEIVTIKEI